MNPSRLCLSVQLGAQCPKRWTETWTQGWGHSSEWGGGLPCCNTVGRSGGWSAQERTRRASKSGANLVLDFLAQPEDGSSKILEYSEDSTII